MLELDQIELTLGPRHWAFDLELPSESVHALLGRSGSGKSTLLNLVAGFIPPDRGDIRWHERSVLSQEPQHRPVTTLFQQDNLFPHLSIARNVGLGINPALKLTPIQWQAVDSALESVGLDGQQRKKPAALSGGEQQRAAIARCLLQRRPILLLDEPFSSLDAHTRSDMIELVRRVIDDLRPCVLMVTHDPDDARQLGAEPLYLYKGSVHREPPPA